MRKIQLVLVVSYQGIDHVSTHDTMYDAVQKFLDVSHTDELTIGEMLRFWDEHEVFSHGYYEFDSHLNAGHQARFEFWDTNPQNPISFDDKAVREQWYADEISRIDHLPSDEAHPYEAQIREMLAAELVKFAMLADVEH